MNGLSGLLSRKDQMLNDGFTTEADFLHTPYRATAPFGKHAGELTGKRGFDLIASVIGLPVLAVLALVLLMVNPFYNRGPLFFFQIRMGRDCQPFRAIKFRTMQPVGLATRDFDAPLEVERITRLGGLLRSARIDEIPQILNVLLGQMSIIGPRPDFYVHAEHFLKVVPGYRERHLVRPGISGLAQTEIGYVEGAVATRAKVNADLYYIVNRGWRLELWIVWRTLAVIFRREGV